MSSIPRKRGNSGEGSSQHAKSVRSPLACERCRIKKLRCAGGNPCRSCQNASAECSFDLGLDKSLGIGGVELSVRVTQLERELADLRGLVHGMLNKTGPVDGDVNQLGLIQSPLVEPTPGVSSLAESVPSSYHAAESPAHRLVASTVRTTQGFSAPFPPLMFYPRIFDNRSRTPTPTPDSAPKLRVGVTSLETKVTCGDQPLSLQILDRETAIDVYEVFWTKCHPLFPFIAYKSLDEMSRYSSFLCTIIIAIAGRFYNGHCLVSNSARKRLTSDQSKSISQLAHSHLALSMFRKEYGIGDVQAVLLLSVWNIHGSGQSPDQWMLSGHCGRIAHRIGLEKTASRGEEVLAQRRELEIAATELRSLMEHWATLVAWLTQDNLFSLGLGRPHVSPDIDPAQHTFSALIDARPEIWSTEEKAQFKVLVAIFELSVLGRNLVPAAQFHAVSPPVLLSQTKAFLTNFNRQLDTWTANHMTDLSLGPHWRLSQMYCDHMRLCINSVAVNHLGSSDSTAGQEDLARHAVLAECAALSIINLQRASLSGDYQLAYAGEYLNLVSMQAAVFLIRLHMTELPYVIDKGKLREALSTMLSIWANHSVSSTGTAAFFSRLCNSFCDLAGVVVASSEEQPSVPLLDQGEMGLDWLLGSQSMETGGNDFSQLFGFPDTQDLFGAGQDWYQLGI